MRALGPPVPSGCLKGGNRTSMSSPLPSYARCRGVLLGLLALTLPVPIVAQEVQGSVRDRSTGTLLENVLVRVDSVGAVTLTDAEGWFILRRLRRGRYSVSFQMMGYDTVHVEVEVPAGEPLEILMPPRPIEVPGLEVTASSSPRRVLPVETEMDVRLARLPGDNWVVNPERIRLYDTIHAKDPYRLLHRELGVGWAFDMEALRHRIPGIGKRPEVYIDDRRTWLINLVLMPTSLLCRVEMYAPPPYLMGDNVPFQLRAYTCLFMAEVLEGKRQMRRTINWGDLIAGPGGGGE